MTKVCSSCKQEKDFGEFYKKRDGKDGFSAECKACKRESSRAWREANPEKKRESNSAWYETHSERGKELSRAWQVAHPERGKENNRAWHVAHPEASRKFSNQYRARKRDNGGTLSVLEWEWILLRHGYQCANCGASNNLEQDHIIPISKGGEDSANNVQPLCASCNHKKHTKTIDYRSERDKLQYGKE